MTFFFDQESLGEVILDTSAIINLAGSGYGEQILKALPYEFLTTDIVRDELHEGRMRGWNHAKIFDSMVKFSLVKVLNIESDCEKTFESLVLGNGANTLDDGEASVLAVAAPRAAIVALDENKAMRITRERFPNMQLISSCDLFRHPAVKKALTKSEMQNAIFSALSTTRMRVLEHHRDWVLETIGSKDVAKCTSLPRSLRTHQVS